MKLTYEAILANPDLLNDLLVEAKRERARAMRRLVFAPVARLFHRPAKARDAAALHAACS